MRRFIINLLYKLIELIENIQYRNIDLDENDISKKIIGEYDVSNYMVTSDSGLVDIDKMYITQPYTHYTVILEDGKKLTCADNHILFDIKFNEVFVKDLKTNDIVKTEDGNRKVKEIIKSKRKTSMGDLSIAHKDHRYYTNGILSHNTICASIYILHYMLFNDNKSILLAANKLDTSKEVLDKIKIIYQSLPFFLQKGIDVWNVGQIKFENGCRAKAFSMTKNSSIGNTGDLVYIDEFAHIADTIVNNFYKSIFPTLSSIENSKMIITSTPSGFNLFHKLLKDAQREPTDPLKNNFEPLVVYWHQVPGRNVTYFKVNEHLLPQYNMDIDMLYEQVEMKYNPNNMVSSNNIPIVMLKPDSTTGKKWIHIQNTDGLKYEDLKNTSVLNRDGDEIFITQVAEVSTWKLDAIKDIGGLDNFNQEYDLRFAAGSRSVLNEETIERMTKNKKPFVKVNQIEELGRLRWDYSSLKFTEDWDMSNRKRIYGMISIDIAEGLGQDYSVINMFKLGYKPMDLIEKQKDTYSTRQDFYQLSQFGMFRSNIVSVEQLAELAYLLIFHFFEPDNFRVVVEYNNDGKQFLVALKNVFERENDFSNYVILKFKHRLDAVESKLGLRVGASKNKYVKDYQDRLEGQDFVIYEENTINEIGTFISHTTNAGNTVYRGDGSNDDCAMTVVNLTQGWTHNSFKELIEDFNMENKNTIIESMMNEILEKDKSLGTDYSTFFKAKGNARIGGGGTIRPSDLI